MRELLSPVQLLVFSAELLADTDVWLASLSLAVFLFSGLDSGAQGSRDLKCQKEQRAASNHHQAECLPVCGGPGPRNAVTHNGE